MQWCIYSLGVMRESKLWLLFQINRNLIEFLRWLDSFQILTVVKCWFWSIQFSNFLCSYFKCFYKLWWYKSVQFAFVGQVWSLCPLNHVLFFIECICFCLRLLSIKFETWLKNRRMIICFLAVVQLDGVCFGVICPERLIVVGSGLPEVDAWLCALPQVLLYLGLIGKNTRDALDLGDVVVHVF